MALRGEDKNEAVAVAGNVVAKRSAANKRCLDGWELSDLVGVGCEGAVVEPIPAVAW